MKQLFKISLRRVDQDERFIWKRRDNLSQCKIIVAYANTYEIYEASDANQVQERNKVVVQSGGKIFYGIEHPIFNFLVNSLNFSVIWVHATDNKYGSVDPNTGKWNGAVGMVANNGADMGLNWFSVSSLRASVIRFSITFQSIKYKLYMKRPTKSSSLNWCTFFNVFSPRHLMALACTFVM